jgi:nucleoid-associated protein YgaU
MKAYREILVYHFVDGTKLLEENSNRRFLSPEDDIHRVGSEQRLVDIAFAFYGDHEEWYGLALANNLIDPWEDLIGQQIIIPSIR